MVAVWSPQWNTVGHDRSWITHHSALLLTTCQTLADKPRMSSKSLRFSTRSPSLKPTSLSRKVDLQRHEVHGMDCGWDQPEHQSGRTWGEVVRRRGRRRIHTFQMTPKSTKWFCGLAELADELEADVSKNPLLCIHPAFAADADHENRKRNKRLGEFHLLITMFNHGLSRRGETRRWERMVSNPINE